MNNRTTIKGMFHLLSIKTTGSTTYRISISAIFLTLFSPYRNFLRLMIENCIQPAHHPLSEQGIPTPKSFAC